MNTPRKARVIAGAVAVLLGGSTLAVAPAQAAHLRTKSLYSYLTAQPQAFDSNGDDYDIVTAAVQAVTTAKPMSPVALLKQGSVALTAFLPNDRAFGNLVAALTGLPAGSEADTFAAVAGLPGGIDAVEQILEYHVVPGQTITSTMALGDNGQELPTALMGKTIKVSVSGSTIKLGDYDPVAVDPTVILSQVDLNKGNLQIAHGIDAVLLPAPVLASLGEASLASVLDAPSAQAFDHDPSDFDIVTKAVYAVLAVKSSSPVAALADGSVRLTAFLPTDGAFQALVSRYTNHAPVSEEDTFAAIAGLPGGIDTVEQVLEYHVVPGGPITAADALTKNGASLTTVLGSTIGVSVADGMITLADKDPIATDPMVNLAQTDINLGNKQVAHGIDGVLLPLALLSPLGTDSLASLLTAESPAFDRNGRDFDVVTAAVLAVLGANPDSPVKALTDGSIALTAFIPNDNAFIKLARSLTTKRVRTEAQAFRVVARLGLPAIEQILLYHVVVGDAILSEQALAANGATLPTALEGKSIRVRVKGSKITLIDLNSRRNPRVILSQVDINRGNLQVAHGIDRVLIPVKRLRSLRG